MSPTRHFGGDLIRLLPYSALTLFATLAALELMQGDEPLTASNVVVDMAEIGLLVLAVAATAHLAAESRDFRQQRSSLIADLAKARAEGDRWRAAARVHIEGLSRAIQAQFDAWGLTHGEADIAVLILKGLSHKEIARLRRSGEATVRQQARSIYRKSGLATRAELSAFFLEDLLAPQAERGDYAFANVAALDANDAGRG